MLSAGGDETLLDGGAVGTGAGFDAGAGEEKSSKSPKRSFGGGLAGEGTFGGGGGDCVKAKSRPFDGARAGAGGDFGCVEGAGGRLSKKVPPLKGGGDVTFGADGADLVGMLGVNLLRSENADCCFGGGGGDVVEGKLRPLKAFVKPPKASGCAGGGDCGGGEAMPPKDGCLLCGEVCG